MSTEQTPSENLDPLRVEVLRGQPDAEQLAAIIAVVSEAYLTEAATTLAPAARPLSAWQRSARGLRAPLRRELGWTGSRGC